MSLRRWMTAFTVLGVAARLLRYVLKFPLWEDESFLSVSVAHRSYREMLQALEYHQVAPVPFLWLQKAVTDLFGFNEWSLRLVACVAGIAALFVFRRIVTRLLEGWAKVAAYGFFAVAYPGIRYGAEAKPYAVDLLMSVLVLWCVVEWLPAHRRRWLWALAALSPLAIVLSLPASMVVCAASLVIGRVLWRPAGTAGRPLMSQRGEWLAWASMNAAALASGLLAIGLLRATTDSGLTVMRAYWTEHFLPVREFWLIPGWMLNHLTGDYLAIPLGGRNFGSTGTFLLVCAGLSALWRHHRTTLVWLVLLPVAINLLLSALGFYPFGGAVKLAIYEMPMVCIAAGTGLAAVMVWASSPGLGRSRVETVLLCAIALIAVGTMARDVMRPQKTLSDQRARQWARGFWGASWQTAERVDLKTDLGLDFSPSTFVDLSWSAMYLVNREIYLRRARENREPDFVSVSRDRPLVVAEYHDVGQPYDDAARDRWLESMTSKYALTSTEDVPMHRYDKRERKLLTADFVRLHTFAPRPVMDGRR